MAKIINTNENNELQKKTGTEIINTNENNELQKKTGTEIIVVRDEIKKDLTNFLVGLSSVTSDPKFYTDFQDLISKTLSPTMDISVFTNELLQLLKNNTIKDERGINFAPIVQKEKDTKVVTNTGENGDSISVGTFAANNPRTFASNQEEIITSTYTKNAEKNDEIINEDLIASSPQTFITKTAGGKNVNVNTIIEDTKKDEEINPGYTGFGAEPAPLSAVGNYLNQEGDRGNNEDLGMESETNPKFSANSSLEINPELSTSNNKTEEEINPELSTSNNKTETDVTIDLALSNNKTEEEINPELSTGNNKTDKVINTTVNNIIEDASRSKRGVNHLNTLLYNAIPYGIGGTLSSMASLGQELSNNATSSAADIIASGPMSATSIFGGILEANRIFNKADYFTMDEIAYFYGIANFYTIQLRRGLTIKDFRTPLHKAQGGLFVTHVDPQNIGQPKIWFRTPSVNPFRPTTPPNADEQIGIYKLRSGGNILKDEVEIKRDSLIEYAFPSVEAGNIEFNEKVDGISTRFTYEPEYVLNARINKNNTIKREDLNNNIKDKEGVWKIGSIYIWPVSGKINPKFVPFQFNPVITEGGVTARYNTQTVLSRIGNLQSFVGVDSLTVTLETSYLAVSRGDDDTAFSLKDIQLIELNYRALNLPWYESSGETEEGYKYYKPPLLKIIMGDKNKIDKVGEAKKGADIFSNLLTYPDNVLGTENFKSQSKLRHFKTFIATSVTITKDIQNMPLHLDDDGVLKDTFGFTVNINLIEVASTYFDSMPHFNNYYEHSYGDVQSV